MGKPAAVACVHQVARDLRLAIDQHALAAGQRREIDAVAFAADEDLEAVVHEAFAVHAVADAGLVEQVDGDLLEHARTDAAEHVVAGLPLEHDRVDARPVQQLAEQQARLGRRLRSRPGSACQCAVILGANRSCSNRRGANPRAEG